MVTAVVIGIAPLLWIILGIPGYLRMRRFFLKRRAFRLAQNEPSKADVWRWRGQNRLLGIATMVIGGPVASILIHREYKLRHATDELGGH